MKALIKSIFPESFLEKRKERKRRELASKRYLRKGSGDFYCIEAFDHFKCIFVHIPKAAGVSINKALFGNLAGGHQSVKEYQEIFIKESFQSYFKFTITRNPIDRLVSAFNFLKSGGFDERDAKWSSENLSEYTDINTFISEWLNEETMYLKNHFMPQVYFLKNQEGKVDLDFIGKLENIDQDFQTICEKLNIQAELKQINTTKKKEQTELTLESIEKLKILYQEDFNLLNYN